MSPPTLYFLDVSPPVRGVVLVAKALGVELDIKPLNLAAGEHLTPEFLKINPQHTVPTLVDDGFAIWDGHVIGAYLADKYGKDDSLYPKDLKQRAIVQQRLHFDSGLVQPILVSIVRPIIREGAKSVPKDKADALVEAYKTLEAFLKEQDYVAGNKLSIADLILAATISSSNVLVPIAENRFPGISDWLSRIRELPYYAEANQKGLDKYAAFLKSKLA